MPLATAICTFGGANAGNVLVPASLFATSIHDEIIAKVFKTNIDTIQMIKVGSTTKS